MQFDLFHSIGRIDSLAPRPTDRGVFAGFFEQLELADALGLGTIWVAESHFSSELQKQNPDPVIPHYMGEVGLNADSPQLAHLVFARTKKIGFGTAIYNVVGGNGGPIAAADRIRSLAFLNNLSPNPRRLEIGIASGRFPYINRPFGIVPRTPEEAAHWPQCARLILAEAVQIFLRLSHGEAFGSADVVPPPAELTPGFRYPPRWNFERLRLVPDLDAGEPGRNLRFVLGSADEFVRETALRHADCDIFNLSFTPPAQIEKIHTDMFSRYAALGRRWHRSRLPRTVLVFIDQDRAKAEAMASACFDTYIEAMRGTAQVPDKGVLMARALIGDPAMIRAQLSSGSAHGFHADDRLMLWFEFNQNDSSAICRQMRLFAEQVMPEFVS